MNLKLMKKVAQLDDSGDLSSRAGAYRALAILPLAAVRPTLRVLRCRDPPR